MSQATPPARRALGGLPPRTPRPAAGVARLIRSNRDSGDPTDDAVEAPSTRAVFSIETGGSPTGRAARSQSPVVNDSQTPGASVDLSGVPKYLQLVRREARMHARQVSALSDLTRALNEARRGGGRSGVGERITDNTLVRVAVDLLLQDPQRIRGTTEDELRASVGLPPLGSGTSTT